MKLMVALDGSQISEKILPTIRSLAALTDAEVKFVTVVGNNNAPRAVNVARLKNSDSTTHSGTSAFRNIEMLPVPPTKTLSEVNVTAGDRLVQTAWEMEGRYSEIIRLFPRGRANYDIIGGINPARAIVRHSLAWGADVVALSTHGRSGITKWVQGSTAAALLGISPLPLLLERQPRSEEQQIFRTLVVPLDGSATAESALGYAVELASSSTAAPLKVRLISVIPSAPSMVSPEGYPWDPDMQLSKERAVEAYLAGKKNDLLSLGIDVDCRVSTGSVCDEICRFAESDPASVIVMSTHGRSGIRRFLLGSVAEKVMQRARVPLMVARSNVDSNEGPPQGEHDFSVESHQDIMRLAILQQLRSDY